MKAKEVCEKHKQTCLDKYGVTNVSQCEDIKRKKKEAYLKKYGVDNPNKAEEIKIKKKETCLAKYNVETPFQDGTAREKATNTYLEHFGVTNPQKAEEIKEKTKQTCIEKYGVDNYTKTEEYKIKAKQTNLDKYGVEYYSQTLDFHKKVKKHYLYENESFDSFPELCFYLYNKQNNINIERTPCQFSFIFEDKVHMYIPDFKIDDEVYEIKGDQFLAEDGTWQCPFDHTLDDLFKAKQTCALEHNVKILYYNDYIQYIDWFYKNSYKKEDFIV